MALRDQTIYAAPLSAKEKEEIFKMRERIEKERTKGHDPAREIKLGAGGIIDIEFAAQMLQLSCGHRETAVRVSGTLPALKALAAAGPLSPADAEILEKGYRFLRTLENKLRIVSDRSLDTLPADPAELEHCARRVGYRAAGGQTAAEQLTADFRRHARAVRETYLKLFYEQ